MSEQKHIDEKAFWDWFNRQPEARLPAPAVQQALADPLFQQRLVERYAASEQDSATV